MCMQIQANMEKLIGKLTGKVFIKKKQNKNKLRNVKLLTSRQFCLTQMDYLAAN